MVSITNTADKLKFTEGDNITYLNKNEISEMSLKKDLDKIIIKRLGANRNYVRIDFDQVSAPVCTDVGELFSLLHDYWTVNTGGYHVFTVTDASGQTTFDCSPYFNLTSDYKVFVNGAYTSGGHSGSTTTSIVTFTTAVPVGSEVMIMI